jgi:signal transduction histidine kinase
MDSHSIRVLVIEDDEDDYLLARKQLSQTGGKQFALDWVNTYEAGLEGLCRGGHDVYLLDYQLGARTGLELLREAAARGCRGPVILLAGHGNREVDLGALEAGAADHLVKGRFDAATLERSIRYALERWRVAEALRKTRDELESQLAERTRALAEANARLAESDRRRDEFLATLAHELRNPLTPILNGLHLLRLPDGDGWSRERVRQMMERQVWHLARLVDDLLDVARITRGQMPLKRERLDLAAVVRTAAEDGRAAVEQAGLRLTVEVPGAPVRVQADATRVAQIVTNLLDNAAKFTQRGGSVAVRVGVDAERRQAVLAVRDTGVGIAREMLPRLFAAFSQADRSIDRTKGGLGLGLALVRGLAALHGGSAEAHSEGPGRGAEFVVRLPLEGEAPAANEAGGGAATAGGRLRVLVVEDNRDAAESMRMLLELYGHEARVAYTGPEGVTAARQWRPEVILCDIGLPGLDGYGVAREVRRDPTLARTRLIAVTGYGQDEDRRRAAEAGFERHLTKPVEPDALQPLLTRAAERKG